VTEIQRIYHSLWQILTPETKFFIMFETHCNNQWILYVDLVRLSRKLGWVQIMLDFADMQ